MRLIRIVANIKYKAKHLKLQIAFFVSFPTVVWSIADCKYIGALHCTLAVASRAVAFFRSSPSLNYE